MRFFVCSDDVTDPGRGDGGWGVQLSDATSVARVKSDFFDCLRCLGELNVIDGGTDRRRLTLVFQESDAFFAAVHVGKLARSLDALSKRAIYHSLGSLMFPDRLLRAVYSVNHSLFLTMTEFQAQRIRQALGGAAPLLAAFPPRLDDDFFRPPNKEERRNARHTLGLREEEFHIVYAGRWLATKGIIQLYRTLKLWPLKGARVTLVGAFQPLFPLRMSSASHAGFQDFFLKEVALNSSTSDLRLIPPKGRRALRTFFWSADLAVFASIHEDENFGLAPREAALCGVPVIATDFCGLSPLGNVMPWGAIPTYPTAVGVRYSLRGLRERIGQALDGDRKACRKIARSFVQAECGPRQSKSSLLKGIQLLQERVRATAPSDDNGAGEGLSRLLKCADQRFVSALFANRPSRPPSGCFPWGSGPYELEYPLNELLRETQAIYLSRRVPPAVEPGMLWRGFFRLVIWESESAVVEFGYPGPRVFRYRSRDWAALRACAREERNGEVVFAPRTKHQVRLVEVLVDFGYLVPDVEEAGAGN